MQIEPRFIHIQEETENHNGITIAYMRNDTFIYFAYSFACKPDQYNKSQGRVWSYKQYLKHFNQCVFQEEFIDTYNRHGVITLDTVVPQGTLDLILADHYLSNISLRDFKHSFVSGVLAAYVCEAIQ